MKFSEIVKNYKEGNHEANSYYLCVKSGNELLAQNLPAEAHEALEKRINAMIKEKSEEIEELTKMLSEMEDDE